MIAEQWAIIINLTFYAMMWMLGIVINVNYLLNLIKYQIISHRTNSANSPSPFKASFFQSSLYLLVKHELSKWL